MADAEGRPSAVAAGGPGDRGRASDREASGGPSDAAKGGSSGRRRSLRGAVALTAVFVVCLALAVWLYPDRRDVTRPRPFSIAFSSYLSGGFATQYVTVRADPPDWAGRSRVLVSVAPHGDSLYDVGVTWTYQPEICPSDSGGCVTPGTGVTSQMDVTLPPGELVTRCACGTGSAYGAAAPKSKLCPSCRMVQSEGVKAEAVDGTFDTATIPQPTIPDVNDAGPPQLSAITARWSFQVRAANLAWDENGLSAQGVLPSVSFQDIGDTGFGSLAATYRIPDGSTYSWDTGPVVTGSTWTEPVAAAVVAQDIGGTNSAASQADTLDVLITGALLGIAGGALVGAIQELLHAERRVRTGGRSGVGAGTTGDD